MPRSTRGTKKSAGTGFSFSFIPLTLGLLEEARATSEQLREHLSDGAHDRLELRRLEVAYANVLPSRNIEIVEGGRGGEGRDVARGERRGRDPDRPNVRALPDGSRSRQLMNLTMRSLGAPQRYSQRP